MSFMNENNRVVMNKSCIRIPCFFFQYSALNFWKFVNFWALLNELNNIRTVRESLVCIVGIFYCIIQSARNREKFARLMNVRWKYSVVRERSEFDFKFIFDQFKFVQMKNLSFANEQNRFVVNESFADSLFVWKVSTIFWWFDQFFCIRERIEILGWKLASSRSHLRKKSSYGDRIVRERFECSYVWIFCFQVQGQTNYE